MQMKEISFLSDISLFSDWCDRHKDPWCDVCDCPRYWCSHGDLPSAQCPECPGIARCGSISSNNNLPVNVCDLGECQYLTPGAPLSSNDEQYEAQDHEPVKNHEKSSGSSERLLHTPANSTM